MIHGSATPYQIAAPMTYATAAELFKRGKQLLTNSETVFDLAGVTIADSAALAVILGWQRAAGEGRLRLINLPASVVSLAELYGVVDLLAIGQS